MTRPPLTLWGAVKKFMLYGQRVVAYPSGFFDLPGGRLPTPNVEIPTPDGALLRGLFLKHTSSKMTVIMFHGNAESGSDDFIVSYFAKTFHVNVLALSYRGYGQSTGVPSEKGLKIDAQTALDYILGLDLKLPIVIFGHSLGGAVAINLVAYNPDKIRALIINNTFLSIPKIKWDSATKLADIPSTIPILMLSGRVDRVVPPEHMKILWGIRSRKTAGVASNDKFVLLPFTGHNENRVDRNFFSNIAEFLLSLEELDNPTGSNASSNASIP